VGGSHGKRQDFVNGTRCSNDFVAEITPERAV
jgi:hypothetical protein